MLSLLQQKRVYHSLLWLLAIATLAVLLVSTTPASEWYRIPAMVGVIFGPLLVGTYLVFYLRTRFLEKRNYLWFGLGVVACIAFMVGLSHGLLAIWPVLKTTWQQDVINYSAITFLILGMQYLKRGLVGQVQLQELRAKKAEAELNMLKAQINPHFLFNTLNNIYATNQIDADRGSEMILELSEVMRYHLHSSQVERVRMDEEIQLLQSYIQLEQLRLNPVCELKIEMQAPEKPLQIAPLLLLPFVENAFKHGTHPTQASFVHLNLAFTGRTLKLELSNSVIAHKKVVRTQVGMENTRRRLQLNYPNRHQLEVRSDADTYELSLSIEL